MVEFIQKCVRTTDKAIAGLYLSLRRERNALLCFLFHSLFRDERQIAQNQVDPLQHTTVAQLRQFIEYYLESGYRFVSPTEVLAGLEPPGKYALLTFDDGYYNNVLARPVLEEYGVPAIFFISTGHVRENRSFWWDVLYRERFAQGASHHEIYQEGIALKGLRARHLEAILTDRFGPDAFRPRGDIDRPFSAEELREFAQSPLVHIGNHTENHAILTNYSPSQIREQIAAASQWLTDLIGKPVVSIAYPNGAFNPQVVEACKELGLKVGFTVRPSKNRLPLAGGSSLLQLNRFAPHEGDSMRAQCRTYRSDLLLYSSMREAYLRLAGRSVVH